MLSPPLKLFVTGLLEGVKGVCAPKRVKTSFVTCAVDVAQSIEETGRWYVADITRGYFLKIQNGLPEKRGNFLSIKITGRYLPETWLARKKQNKKLTFLRPTGCP